MKEPKVSVIIVNFNGLNFLPKLFESLANQTYKNLEIIFVDNGSSDDSINFIKTNYPITKIITSTKNLGFTGGNNLGIKSASGEIIVLLNNDTYVEEDWAKEIVNTFQKNPDVGITSSKITYFTKYIPIQFSTQIINEKDLLISQNAKEIGAEIKGLKFINTNYNKIIIGNSHHSSEDTLDILEKTDIYIPHEETTNTELIFEAKGNNFIKNQTLKLSVNDKVLKEIKIDQNFNNFSISISKEFIEKNEKWVINTVGTKMFFENGWNYDEGIDNLDNKQFDKENYIDAACGCSLGVRKDVIDQIGMLDPIYFAYFEDTDFSLRAKEKGWKIKYVPGSVVRHFHTGTSSKKKKSFFNYRIQRNRLISFLLYGKLKYCIKEFIRFNFKTAFFTIRAILSTIKNNQYKEANLSLAQTYLHALFSVYLNLPRIFIKRLFR